MGEYLLRNTTLVGHSGLRDIRVGGDRIIEVGPGLGYPGATTVDLTGWVVIPGLRDDHAHVDKTLWGGPWAPRTAGSGLASAIEYGIRRRSELGIPSVAHISALMGAMVSSGTYHTRTHVDVDPDIGLDGLHAVRQAAADLGERLAVEIVAFPQAGLLTWRGFRGSAGVYARPGTRQLLDAALAEGADIVGGIDPAGYDGDAVAHLDAVFALAERHTVPSTFTCTIWERSASGNWN